MPNGPHPVGVMVVGAIVDQTNSLPLFKRHGRISLGAQARRGQQEHLREGRSQSHLAGSGPTSLNKLFQSTPTSFLSRRLSLWSPRRSASISRRSRKFRLRSPRISCAILLPSACIAELSGGSSSGSLRVAQAYTFLGNGVTEQWNRPSWMAEERLYPGFRLPPPFLVFWSALILVRLSQSFVLLQRLSPKASRTVVGGLVTRTLLLRQRGHRPNSAQLFEDPRLHRARPRPTRRHRVTESASYWSAPPA
jgi:hypothetical protein